MAKLDTRLSKKEIIYESKQIDSKWKKLNKVGEEYIKDKEKLEEALKHFQELQTEDEDAGGEIVGDLELGLQQLYEQYQKKVKNEMDKLAALQQKIDEDAVELQDKFAKERDRLQNLKMKETNWNSREVSAKAEKERSELEQIALANKNKLDLRIQAMQRQQRELRAKKLSGRK